jgi:hypothetical protein
LGKVSGIPASHAPSHGNTFFIRLLLEEADGKAFQPGQVIRGDTISDPTFVFAKGNIQAPMQSADPPQSRRAGQNALAAFSRGEPIVFTFLRVDRRLI